MLAGETERFAVIVERYQCALLRVAESRLARREWAEDVVQEAFFCAYKSLRSYDSRYSFRTWLWTILLNQCRRHMRRQANSPLRHAGADSSADSLAQLGSDLQDDGAAPDAALLTRERRQLLERLLSALPQPQADALRLRFFGGLKFQEIADAMHCSLSSAKNRVRRGLATMSELISESATPGSTGTLLGDLTSE